MSQTPTRPEASPPSVRSDAPTASSNLGNAQDSVRDHSQQDDKASPAGAQAGQEPSEEGVHSSSRVLETRSLRMEDSPFSVNQDLRRKEVRAANRSMRRQSLHFAPTVVPAKLSVTDLKPAFNKILKMLRDRGWKTPRTANGWAYLKPHVKKPTVGAEGIDMWDTAEGVLQHLIEERHVQYDGFFEEFFQQHPDQLAIMSSPPRSEDEHSSVIHELLQDDEDQENNKEDEPAENASGAKANTDTKKPNEIESHDAESIGTSLREKTTKRRRRSSGGHWEPGRDGGTGSEDEGRAERSRRRRSTHGIPSPGSDEQELGTWAWTALISEGWHHTRGDTLHAWCYLKPEVRHKGDGVQDENMFMGERMLGRYLLNHRPDLVDAWRLEKEAAEEARQEEKEMNLAGKTRRRLKSKMKNSKGSIVGIQKSRGKNNSSSRGKGKKKNISRRKAQKRRSQPWFKNFKFNRDVKFGTLWPRILRDKFNWKYFPLRGVRGLTGSWAYALPEVASVTEGKIGENMWVVESEIVEYVKNNPELAAKAEAIILEQLRREFGSDDDEDEDEHENEDEDEDEDEDDDEKSVSKTSKRAASQNKSTTKKRRPYNELNDGGLVDQQVAKKFPLVFAATTEAIWGVLRTELSWRHFPTKTLHSSWMYCPPDVTRATAIIDQNMWYHRDLKEMVLKNSHLAKQVERFFEEEAQEEVRQRQMAKEWRKEEARRRAAIQHEAKRRQQERAKAQIQAEKAAKALAAKREIERRRARELQSQLLKELKDELKVRQVDTAGFQTLWSILRFEYGWTHFPYTGLISSFVYALPEVTKASEGTMDETMWADEDKLVAYVRESPIWAERCEASLRESLREAYAQKMEITMEELLELEQGNTAPSPKQKVQSVVKQKHNLKQQRQTQQHSKDKESVDRVSEALKIGHIDITNDPKISAGASEGSVQAFTEANEQHGTEDEDDLHPVEEREVEEEHDIKDIADTNMCDGDQNDSHMEDADVDDTNTNLDKSSNHGHSINKEDEILDDAEVDFDDQEDSDEVMDPRERADKIIDKATSFNEVFPHLQKLGWSQKPNFEGDGGSKRYFLPGALPKEATLGKDMWTDPMEALDFVKTDPTWRKHLQDLFASSDFHDEVDSSSDEIERDDPNLRIRARRVLDKADFNQVWDILKSRHWKWFYNTGLESAWVYAMPHVKTKRIGKIDVDMFDSEESLVKFAKSDSHTRQLCEDMLYDLLYEKQLLDRERDAIHNDDEDLIDDDENEDEDQYSEEEDELLDEDEERDAHDSEEADDSDEDDNSLHSALYGQAIERAHDGDLQSILLDQFNWKHVKSTDPNSELQYCYVKPADKYGAPETLDFLSDIKNRVLSDANLREDVARKLIDKWRRTQDPNLQALRGWEEVFDQSRKHARRNISQSSAARLRTRKTIQHSSSIVSSLKRRRSYSRRRSTQGANNSSRGQDDDDDDLEDNSAGSIGGDENDVLGGATFNMVWPILKELGWHYYPYSGLEGSWRYALPEVEKARDCKINENTWVKESDVVDYVRSDPEWAEKVRSHLKIVVESSESGDSDSADEAIEAGSDNYVSDSAEEEDRDDLSKNSLDEDENNESANNSEDGNGDEGSSDEEGSDGASFQGDLSDRKSIMSYLLSKGWHHKKGRGLVSHYYLAPHVKSKTDGVLGESIFESEEAVCEHFIKTHQPKIKSKNHGKKARGTRQMSTAKLPARSAKRIRLESPISQDTQRIWSSMKRKGWEQVDEWYVSPDAAPTRNSTGEKVFKEDHCTVFRSLKRAAAHFIMKNQHTSPIHVSRGIKRRRSEVQRAEEEEEEMLSGDHDDENEVVVDSDNESNNMDENDEQNDDEDDEDDEDENEDDEDNLPDYISEDNFWDEVWPYLEKNGWKRIKNKRKGAKRGFLAPSGALANGVSMRFSRVTEVCEFLRTQQELRQHQSSPSSSSSSEDEDRVRFDEYVKTLRTVQPTQDTFWTTFHPIIKAAGWTYKYGTGIHKELFFAPGVTRQRDAVEGETRISSCAAMCKWIKLHRATIVQSLREALLTDSEDEDEDDEDGVDEEEDEEGVDVDKTSLPGKFHPSEVDNNGVRVSNIISDDEFEDARGRAEYSSRRLLRDDAKGGTHGLTQRVGDAMDQESDAELSNHDYFGREDNNIVNGESDDDISHAGSENAHRNPNRLRRLQRTGLAKRYIHPSGRELHEEYERTRDVTSKLKLQWLGREEQIDFLAGLMGPRHMQTSHMLLHGDTATGKTGVIRALITALEYPFAAVDCAECYAPSILFQRLLSQMPRSRTEAIDSMQNQILDASAATNTTNDRSRSNDPASGFGHEETYEDRKNRNIAENRAVLESLGIVLSPNLQERSGVQGMDSEPYVDDEEERDSDEPSELGEGVSLLSRKVQTLERCVTMRDFVLEVSRRLQPAREAKETFYLLLENAARIEELSSNLLPALLELERSSGCNICIIMTSTELSESMSLVLHNVPVCFVCFPAYSQMEQRKIIALQLSKKVGKQYSEMVVRQVVNAVVQTFTSQVRDLREMSRICFDLWEKVVSKPGFAENPQGILRVALEGRVGLTFKMLYHHDFELDPRAENPTDGALERWERDEVKRAADLPYDSKLVLLASFLASYNSPDHDRVLFGNARKLSQRQKHGEALTARNIKNANAGQRLLGPKVFPLERLVNLYRALVNMIDSSAPLSDSTNSSNKQNMSSALQRQPTRQLHKQVASLISAGLLTRVSRQDELDMVKLKCNVPNEFAEALSETVKLDLLKLLES